MASEHRGGGRVIPDGEIKIDVARSGGPGGQSVNTAESKAVLVWIVKDSSVFSDEEKARIRENVSVKEGDKIVLHCSEHRTQLANKKACIERLHEIVNEAIKVQEERKETKIPKSVKKRNEVSDFREKKKKAARGRVDFRE